MTGNLALSFTSISSRAEISPCGLYRYTLERTWATCPRFALFLMLNPSTADAAINDNTVRRCMSFARSWGYSGLLVGNLYAWRATDPSELKTAPDPVGPDNDKHLRKLIARAGVVVCAWGKAGPVPNRFRQVMTLVEEARQTAHFLILNQVKKDGTGARHPSHPLYLPGELVPNVWDWRES